ncbi:hypothetical protein QZH41_020446 [Actinostola sp. cb2023]|nr:hypothetical protein QZH41_020446 [Actinostola sp. cb2023]
MGDWAELGSESACTDTPLTFKRKGHFNIGLYAKRRKLFLQELVDEKITADVKVKSLQNKLNYRKRKEFASEKEKSHVTGVYRPLESLLLRLAHMYLMLDKHYEILHWFNGQKGKFIVAIGADGAPFGKDDTSTSYLVSLLNVLDGVQSCDNNFLLMGANCDETHELMYEYTKHVVQEIKEMEGKVYEVQGDSVTFECKLIPSDQKWMASMAGELNNAATYFSSFANVSKSNVKTIGGTIGDDSSCTWKKWRYEQRMKDVDEVKAFKARNKIPENSKSSNHRGKVTAHIASRKSRQEFSPPLGKYVDNFKPEPLHNSNNAWQHWNLDILTTAMKLTDRAVINKANGDITQLPSITPMAKYMSLLKYKMKAGRLYKNVERWFREKKKAEDFQYRFTGKESKLFCWHFMEICRILIAAGGIPQTTLLHVYGLAYSGLCLRNCVSLFSRVHISESDVDCLRNECEQYYNCHAILLNTVKPTTWTIGKAIPYYTAEIFHDLGFGLGLNSMQGREAKHAKLASYAKNTTRGKRLRWWQMFKHEFMETIWLKEKDPKQVAKKLQCTPGSVFNRTNDEEVKIENDIQERAAKDKYIPPHCLGNNEFCYCGLPKSSSVACCDVCSSEMFKLVIQTCKEGKLNRKLRELVPQIR